MAEFPNKFPFVGGTGQAGSSSSSGKAKSSFPTPPPQEEPRKVVNITGLFFKAMGVPQAKFDSAELANAPSIYKKMTASLMGLKEFSESQDSILKNIKVLADYREKLPGAIAGFQRNQALTVGDLNEIQSRLHTSIGSHLKRIANPTPVKVENYINGLLNQVEGHYERAAREKKLEAFYHGLNTGGCFEEIVQGVDESMQAAYSTNSLQDPLLPNTLNLELAPSSEVVGAYYNKFTEMKMSQVHHGSQREKLDLLEKQGALSKEEFKSFLAGTNFKNITCQSGKLSDKDVDDYFDIYS